MSGNLCSAFLPISAGTCAKSTVLPEDFMTNGGAAPLVGTPTPAPAVETATVSKAAPWLVAGAAAVGLGVLWWAAKGAVPVLAANPEPHGSRSLRKHVTAADVDPEELRKGIAHEYEHTRSRAVAERTALDHLAEDSRYYTHLDEMEAEVKGSEERFSLWDWWREPRPYANPSLMWEEAYREARKAGASDEEARAYAAEYERANTDWGLAEEINEPESPYANPRTTRLVLGSPRHIPSGAQVTVKEVHHYTRTGKLSKRAHEGGRTRIRVEYMGHDYWVDADALEGERG